MKLKYETADGKIFDDEAEAKLHEIDLETQAQLTILLQETLRTGRVEAVIAQIVQEHDAVRNVLLRHAKRQPKVKNKGVEETKAAA